MAGRRMIAVRDKEHMLRRLPLPLPCCWPRCWPAAPARRRPPPPVITPPPAAVVPKVPPRIGLALGGGAARGFAHVGVIQVLEEAGIRPDLVVGHLRRQPGRGAVCQRPHRPAAAGGGAWTWTRRPSPTGRCPSSAAACCAARRWRRYVDNQVGHRLIESMALPLGRGGDRPEVRAGRAVPPRRHRHRGARLQRRAGGVPAGEDRQRRNTSTAAWCRRCRCAMRGRWARRW